MTTKLQNELIIRSIKILDIGYIALLYFIPAMVLAQLMDQLYGEFDKDAELKKSMWQRAIEIIGLLWINAVILYIVKNLVELIPSPFHGLYGFNHFRVRDLTSAAMFTFVFLFCQNAFRSKLLFFKDHMSD